jgi:type I restriction enzyme S subunit
MMAASVPVKYLAEINRASLPDTTPEDFSFTYIDISAVDEAGVVSVPNETSTFAASPSRARRLASQGSTLISTVRTYLRAIARVPISDTQLVFSTGFAVLEASKSVDPEYLYYACRSDQFVDEVVARSAGVSYPAINPSEIGQIPIPVPPLEVQRRIADFLDDQTTRIDHIITARQQQIGLFSARWSVLLDETVESLGVAHGWVPLRRLVTSIEQGWSPQCDSTPALDHEWGVLKLGAVKRGAFRPWENKRLPEDLSPITEYVLRPGDLLITRANTPALVGDAAVVPKGAPSRLLLCDKIMRVELTPEVNVNFIALAAQTSKARQHFSSLSSGTSQSMVNIRGEDVRDLQIPAAPLSAQAAAAERVGEERVRTQAIESGANDSIALLQELKRSLISAAVSGEFDVSAADGSQVVVRHDCG